MYCDICSEPLSSTANGGRCDTCRIEFTGRMVDVIIRLKHKWQKRILEDDLLKCHIVAGNTQQKETNTMTEKEIIQYWVNNRKEMRAFIAAPKECQLWLSTHVGVMNTKQLNGGGNWVQMGVPDSHNQLLPHVVYSLTQIKEVGFIEFNIDEAGRFQHQYQSPAQYKKTYWYNFLEAAPSIGIFGGWFFENKAGAGWSIFQMGETGSGGWTTIADDWVKPLVPKKIRFYKGE